MMAAFLQNLATAHRSLWSGDPWYRRSWFVWPLATLSLVTGWLITHGLPAGSKSQAPWAVPVEEVLSGPEMAALRDKAKIDAAAFERLKNFAGSGDRNAQFYLATLYDPDLKLGKLISPDVNEAIAWYTKAAEQGDSAAQGNLGLYFYYGNYGVTQNIANAVYWFEKAIAQGNENPVVARNFAFCLKEGKGIAADPVRALELFRMAASRGDGNAEGWVGDAYENGWGGVRKNWSEALSRYLKGAEHGDAWSQMRLGEAYFNGSGLQRDPGRAFDLLTRSAEQGQIRAQYDLGVMYEQGIATAADPYQAFQWFEKAAKRGYADAQNALGVAYAEGRGVARNIERARYWFEQAKANGNRKAEANLRNLR